MIAYGQVSETAEHVAIVCTGPSVEPISPDWFRHCGAYVIAVNGAIRRVQSHAFFTCDPNQTNRLLLRNQRKETNYFAAVPNDYGQTWAKNENHRSPAESGVIYLKRLVGVGPWSHRDGLSEDTSAIHTGNSAYGALGVAYHMRPRRIAFFGMDGSTEQYAWGINGNPGDLSHLHEIFKTTIPQLEAAGIEVLNGSPQSTVKCFRRVKPDEALRWISC